jgi:hypothetical protein
LFLYLPKNFSSEEQSELCRGKKFDVLSERQKKYLKIHQKEKKFDEILEKWFVGTDIFF